MWNSFDTIIRLRIVGILVILFTLFDGSNTKHLVILQWSPVVISCQFIGLLQALTRLYFRSVPGGELDHKDDLFFNSLLCRYIPKGYKSSKKNVTFSICLNKILYNISVSILKCWWEKKIYMIYPRAVIMYVNITQSWLIQTPIKLKLKKSNNNALLKMRWD